MSGADAVAGEQRHTRHRRQARIARGVIAAVALLLGIAQGWVWLSLAPTEQFKVFADGSYLSLPTADYHPFDGLALFVYSGAAIGLILAVASWRIRAIRGAATLLTVLVAAAVGAAVAYAIGLLFAGGVDPSSVGATGHDAVVTAAASLGTPLVVIIEPLLAVAAYTFLAAWDGRPDLGSTRAALPATGQPGAAAGSEADTATESNTATDTGTGPDSSTRLGWPTERYSAP